MFEKFGKKVTFWFFKQSKTSEWLTSFYWESSNLTSSKRTYSSSDGVACGNWDGVSRVGFQVHEGVRSETICHNILPDDKTESWIGDIRTSVSTLNSWAIYIIHIIGGQEIIRQVIRFIRQDLAFHRGNFIGVSSTYILYVRKTDNTVERFMRCWWGAH